MASFFDLEEIQNLERGDEQAPGKRMYGCEACGLYKLCRTPKMPAVGNGKKKILIIGDAATADEDRTGNEVHGERYSYTKNMLKSLGIDIKEDCWYTHAIRCYDKSKVSKTTAATLSACHGMLIAEIMELKPKVIIPLSDLAWKQLFYDRDFGRGAEGFYQWAGMTIPDQKLKCWVAPNYDPKIMLEQHEKQINRFELFYNKNWETAIQLPNVAFPRLDPESRCKTTFSEQQAIEWLVEADSWPYTAFDYETTGIKPHRKGHKITHASISNGIVSYGFPMFYTPRFLKAWERWCKNSSVKIAHNMSFERMWTTQHLGFELENFTEDTQLIWHCLHNLRPTGLKYLTFAHYGIIGYDALVDQYIKADSEEESKYGANSMNHMQEAPTSKVAMYCAMDSLFTAWLYRDLKPQLDVDHQLPGYELLIEGQWVFDRMSENGMVLDMEKIAQWKPIIEERMKKAQRAVDESDYIQKNWRGNKAFSASSDANVRRLLYEIMGFPVIDTTDSGEPAVDEEALKRFSEKSPIVLHILELRKWRKIYNTYLMGYEKEGVNGRLRGFFRLNNVATFRSSSNSPNLQNQSKRNKEAKEVVRSVLLPHPGHKLIEYDYKGAEVAASASISGDVNLQAYVNDLSKDMHLDMSTHLYMVERDKVNKALRNVTKGPFVFAEFYGSYWKLVAKGVWDELNIRDAEKVFGFDVIQHLRKEGIRTYDHWEKHVEAQERVLWDKMFPGYQKYREKTYEFFVKHGYVDYVNGFRYEGPATKNEVLNAPVQGPAFHINLWATIQIQKELDRLNMDTKIIGSIHDAVVMSCPPYEEQYVDTLVHKYGTQAVKEHWPWIQTTLMVEKEAGEVNGPWSVMKGCGFVQGVV